MNVLVCACVNDEYVRGRFTCMVVFHCLWYIDI